MPTDAIVNSWKSKTVWLGLALAVFGYLQTQDEILGQWMSGRVAGLVDMLFGLAVIVVRFLTTVPLSEK